MKSFVCISLLASLCLMSCGGGGSSHSNATVATNATPTSAPTATPTPGSPGSSGGLYPYEPPPPVVIPNPTPEPIRPITGPIVGPITPPIHPCPDGGGCGGPISPSTEMSLNPATKDTNLQRGQAAAATDEDRAQELVSLTQMHIDSARQLTVLSNRLNYLENNGQLTDQDRVALADSALSVAGIQSAEVSNAVAAAANGDKQSVEVLLNRAADHLGMSSSASLRDTILPSLGIAVP